MIDGQTTVFIFPEVGSNCDIVCVVAFNVTIDLLLLAVIGTLHRSWIPDVNSFVKSFADDGVNKFKLLEVSEKKIYDYLIVKLETTH
jgi:hypothetical protein